ncbi:acetamidase [Nannizzia gypsea CBS 118893]|uniref:amidase n=1 Tax=Arthroderma gypseum (strain ATCC MYA-4604 / CBS 118893) TaxID=535722 RepID=E5R2C5_ARTGP|nr:acetamidase [Nannizzia gypsea CBS 118893]EFQ97015.1 acetamidase [Nannizzia gypsea CBS 118893]
MAQSYTEISAAAKKRRDDALAAFWAIPDIKEDELPRDLRSYPQTSGLLTAEELEIINSDAVVLLEKLRTRQLSSVTITTAFCKATVIAQKLTNCVTEVLFDEGLKRAKELDDHLERTGKVVGPLHGLPVSLKDNFMTVPHPSSIGMAAYTIEPTVRDSVIVTGLRDLGAVFYVKTNVPTAMLMAETDNRVWGETRNPIHKGLSPGGSSGGEAALLALKASPLGLGTDIGGSIRVPGAFCHLYGLKPSFGRFSTLGGRAAIQGQEFIPSVCGPMAISLESVKLFCETILSEQAGQWNADPKLLPIPWRKDVIQPKGRKLRIGILGNNDGGRTCYPPVERALSIVTKALKDAGHDVFEWAPIDHPEVLRLVIEGFKVFGTSAILPQLEKHGEPLFKCMEKTFSTLKEDQLDAVKLSDMIIERNGLQRAYLERWMATKTDTAGPMDCIIAPAAVAPAARLGYGQTMQYFGFTAFGNLLDLPSCTFPVTYADKAVDLKRDASWTPLNEQDKIMQSEYDPEFYHGAPVSLQLYGKRLEEEKVVEMVEVVADILKFKP